MGSSNTKKEESGRKKYTQWAMFIVFFVIILVASRSYFISNSFGSVSILSLNENYSEKKAAKFISGTSGERFTGKKTRIFSAGLRRFNSKVSSTKMLKTSQDTCSKWVVVTTIFPASEALLQFSKMALEKKVGFTSWCCVIVGDKKSPSYEEAKGCHYLSAADQEKLPYETLKLLPWNHFGRKNAGFLYAIHHGAKFIYDTDDDNVLKSLHIPVIGKGSKVQQVKIDVGHLYNPYPNFGPNSVMWPRGFPLDMINNKTTKSDCMVEMQPFTLEEKVAVVQSLADNDPDVDALYRLTSTLPVTFNNPCNHDIVVLPSHIAAPYNAQATLHTYQGFFGLLLPITVHGRVSDIWRGYFTLPLLWSRGLTLAFRNPWVTQYRNSHDYLKDFDSEKDLYSKATALVEFITEYKPRNLASLPTLMEDLAIEFYEREYWEKEDVHLIQAWIADLLSLGYEFDKIGSSRPLTSKDFIGNEKCCQAFEKLQVS